MSSRDAPPAVGIREAAARLGVSVPTLRRWDRAGKLRATRNPLTGARVYSLDAVEALAGGGANPARDATATPREAAPAASSRDPAFVGRAAELGRLLTNLGRGARVITVLGPGGIGKTTLGRRALEERSRLGGNVASCDLSNVTGERVLAAVAASLDVDLRGSVDEATHVDRLARRLARMGACVLALDNAEHVTARVVALLRALRPRAPLAAFVVMSRQRLRVRDELTIELGPLPTADAVTVLVGAAARAGALVDPQWQRAHAAPLAQIATRLDGIPLALELAGARLATLAPADVLRTLGAQLDLGTRRNDRPARHATLRAAIAWSYDLLADRERELFAGLSVFRGGFDARAAIAVAPEADVSALLETLRDCCIIHSVPSDDAPRFDLYEGLREFAAERLASRPPAEEAIRERHASYYAGLAEVALSAPPTDIAVESLARERENVLAALEWATPRGTDRAVLLAIGADHALGTSMPIGAREKLFDDVLDLGSSRGLDRALLARAYATRGRLRVERSDAKGGVRDLTRAIGLARRAPSPVVEEYVLGTLLVALLLSGSVASIRRALVRLKRIAQGPSRAGRALTWAHIGSASHEIGDLRTAERSYARALAIAQAEGHAVLAARMRARLGRVYVDAGRLDDAEDALGAALPALAGDRFEAWTRAHVALLRWRQGRLDDARESYTRATELFCARGATAFEVLHRVMLGAVLAALARGVDATAEIERARGDAAPLRDRGLEAALALAEAHCALLDARREREGGGGRARAIVRAACSKTRAIAGRDKDVRALAQCLEEMSVADLPTRPSLVVAEDGAWMTAPEGSRTDLPPGSPLRALLCALASPPVEDVSREELIAAAWPGERILPRASTRRLHAAVSELRGHGLGARLERTAGGYRLVPSLPIRRERSAG